MARGAADIAPTGSVDDSKICAKGLYPQINVYVEAIEIMGAGNISANGIYTRKLDKSKLGAFGAEQNLIIEFTHIFNQNYKLRYSHMIRGRCISGWTLVLDDKILYTVQGREDVQTCIYGNWVSFGGEIPAPCGYCI